MFTFYLMNNYIDQKGRLVAFTWREIAVAACGIVMMGIVWWINQTDQKVDKMQLNDALQDQSITTLQNGMTRIESKLDSVLHIKVGFSPKTNDNVELR